MGLWVIIRLELHSVLSHWLTIWIICLVFCSLHSLPSPTDHTWPLPKISARVCSLRTSQLLRPGDNSSQQGSHIQALSSPRLQHPQLSARGCQLPSICDSSTKLPPCLGHCGLTWHKSTKPNYFSSFWARDRRAISAAPPTRTVIAGKVAEGVGLDSYTS